MVVAPPALEQFRFEDPLWLNAAWAGVLVGIVVWTAWTLARRRSIRFAEGARTDAVLGRRRVVTLAARVVLLVGASALLAAAAARPQANPQTRETDARGRDIVFVVDVSRSMLARDVAPNRLERAKLWIRDLVAELGSDRVALVAFAGSASVRAPLTVDRLFFRLALEELGPDAVRVGGTNIGDAIRRCLDLVFYDLDDERGGAHRDIILITDGEDQNSLPIEAARAAGATGVRIIALGIGSEQGAPVLDEEGEVVTDNGRPVRSRLDSDQLARIATATPGGAYLNVGTGDIDLAQVYNDLIARAKRTALQRVSTTTWDELYPWFAIPGAACLALELVLGALGTRRFRPS